MDDSLRAQMPVVREAAEAFGFTLAELDGWEQTMSSALLLAWQRRQGTRL